MVNAVKFQLVLQQFYEAATKTPQRREASKMPRLEELADEIRDLDEEGNRLEQSALDVRIAEGERLIEAKSLLKHGEWLPWLESNFTFGRVTAQSYMALAEANSQQGVNFDDTENVNEAYEKARAYKRQERSQRQREKEDAQARGRTGPRKRETPEGDDSPKPPPTSKLYARLLSLEDEFDRRYWPLMEGHYLDGCTDRELGIVDDAIEFTGKWLDNLKAERKRLQRTKMHAV